MSVRHELDLTYDPAMHEWQARCTGCRDWQGQAEESQRAAIHHHTMHALEATAIFA